MLKEAVKLQFAHFYPIFELKHKKYLKDEEKTHASFKKYYNKISYF